MKSHQFFPILGALGAFCAGASPAAAQPGAREFVPFHRFLENTRSAAQAAWKGTRSRVKDDAAFQEMRRHILSIYEGVQVAHTFVLGSSHFDCVSVMEQPGVRNAGLTYIASEPPESLLPDSREKSARPVRHNMSDEFGNRTGCEEGFIPMRRVTLGEMTQFSTLRDFFRKRPEELSRADGLDAPAAPAADPTIGHKYSTMYQIVDSLGGNSNLNIWSPYVDTASGEEFSLSQEWYMGGSGGSIQTAEVGWHNYPRHYGDQYSRLFIYWTADNYQSSGCYNLDCPAFVQVSSTMPLGGDFGDSYSSPGGTQYEIGATFYLYQGNWWLGIDGTWIGYYPGALYRGGQLTKFAQQIRFGTESYGTTVWPGEGSGDWSTAGWAKAAYQRNLYYFTTRDSWSWDKLTPSNTSPACYNVSGPYSSNSSGWTVYFFEGGPGGSGC